MHIMHALELGHLEPDRRERGNGAAYLKFGGATVARFDLLHNGRDNLSNVVSGEPSDKRSLT